MQVSLETTAELERRLTIGVPAAEIDGAVGERLEKAARCAWCDSASAPASARRWLAKP